MRSLVAACILSLVTVVASPALGQADVAEDAAPPYPLPHEGLPEFDLGDGWTIKPRGRLQLDAGTVSSPEGVRDGRLGYHDEVRRGYLGIEGKIPGGFAYRGEVDLAEGRIDIIDLYLSYQAADGLTFTVGHIKPYWGLEELTSDLFPSFMERAALNGAFRNERRLGAGAEFVTGALLIQGGAFIDNIHELHESEDDPWSIDARAVFMPKVGSSQIHLGGSVHAREFNDSSDSARYQVRPFLHTTDTRFVDTGKIPATGETGYGLEAAYINGPFHAAFEGFWQRVNRLDGPDPTFAGYALEAGMFLTKGDTRGYRKGLFDRVRPANPVGRGGIGAVQVNARLDHLDLNDAGIVGGKQTGYEVALSWTPTAYTRFIANYGRMYYSGAAIPAAGGDRSYAVDAFGVRAQFDF